MSTTASNCNSIPVTIIRLKRPPSLGIRVKAEKERESAVKDCRSAASELVYYWTTQLFWLSDLISSLYRTLFTLWRRDKIIPLETFDPCFKVPVKAKSFDVFLLLHIYLDCVNLLRCAIFHLTVSRLYVYIAPFLGDWRKPLVVWFWGPKPWFLHCNQRGWKKRARIFLPQTRSIWRANLSAPVSTLSLMLEKFQIWDPASGSLFSQK